MSRDVVKICRVKFGKSPVIYQSFSPPNIHTIATILASKCCCKLHMKLRILIKISVSVMYIMTQCFIVYHGLLGAFTFIIDTWLRMVLAMYSVLMFI